MGARRYGSNRSKSKPNLFQSEQLSIPTPQSNTMVFRWNTNTMDFDIATNYDPQKAQGRMSQQDVERAVEMMRESTPNYRIKSDNGAVFCMFICAGLILGFIFSILLASVNGMESYSSIGFYVSLIICCCCGCASNANWEKKVRQRGQDIRKVIETLNREYESRGVRWASGYLGTYFMIIINQQTGGGGFSVPNFPQQMNNTEYFHPNNNMIMNPAPMNNPRPGIFPDSPIPMNHFGGGNTGPLIPPPLPYAAPVNNNGFQPYQPPIQNINVL